MHVDAVQVGETVALIDDVLATGGTAAASINLLEQAGAKVTCAQFLIELGGLKGRQNLPHTRVVSLLEY